MICFCSCSFNTFPSHSKWASLFCIKHSQRKKIDSLQKSTHNNALAAKFHEFSPLLRGRSDKGVNMQTTSLRCHHDDVCRVPISPLIHFTRKWTWMEKAFSIKKCWKETKRDHGNHSERVHSFLENLGIESAISPPLLLTMQPNTWKIPGTFLCTIFSLQRKFR